MRVGEGFMQSMGSASRWKSTALHSDGGTGSAGAAELLAAYRQYCAQRCAVSIICGNNALADSLMSA